MHWAFKIFLPEAKRTPWIGPLKSFFLRPNELLESGQLSLSLVLLLYYYITFTIIIQVLTSILHLPLLEAKRTPCIGPFKSFFLRPNELLESGQPVTSFEVGPVSFFLKPRIIFWVGPVISFFLGKLSRSSWDQLNSNMFIGQLPATSQAMRCSFSMRLSSSMYKPDLWIFFIGVHLYAPHWNTTRRNVLAGQNVASLSLVLLLYYYITFTIIIQILTSILHLPLLEAKRTPWVGPARHIFWSRASLVLPEAKDNLLSRASYLILLG